MDFNDWGQIMSAEHELSNQYAIAKATTDIHDKCKVEIDLLWDDGRSHIADSMHKVKVWNGLGSLECVISHRDLLERGIAYREFLENLSAAVNHRLSLRR